MSLSENLGGPYPGKVGATLEQAPLDPVKYEQNIVRLAVVDESNRLLIAVGDRRRRPQDVIGCRPIV